MLNQICAFAVANLPRKQKGLTTVEYAVAGAMIVAAVVGAFFALGGKVDSVIDAITTALS